MDMDDLVKRFQFHKATEATGAQHAIVRLKCFELASDLNALLPSGREKALAITHLEEVMFWANAAIARNSVELASDSVDEDLKTYKEQIGNLKESVSSWKLRKTD